MRLPTDLQQKVNDGVVDEETARQLAAERSRANWLEDRGRQASARQQNEAAAAQDRAAQQVVDDAANAVTARELEWKKNDPDYSKKQPLVEAEVARLLRADGFPKSSKEAVALFDKARSTIDAHLDSIIPRKAEVRPVTGGSSAKNAQPRPSSMREALSRAL